MEIKEGYMPFMGYQTYYRIVGKTEEGKSPIILLHGGPGSTHNYFELLDRVAESGTVVMPYDDELGIGDAHHLHIFKGNLSHELIRQTWLVLGLEAQSYVPHRLLNPWIQLPL